MRLGVDGWAPHAIGIIDRSDGVTSRLVGRNLVGRVQSIPRTFGPEEE